MTLPIDDDGHCRNYRIGEPAFRNWLSWRAYEEAGFSPAGQTIEDAMRVCEGLAVNRGPCYPVWRRVAEHDEGRTLYLDLCCPKGRVVEIRTSGWRILPRPPREVKFLRSKGMDPLPDPEPGETIELLGEFVNVERRRRFHAVARLAGGGVAAWPSVPRSRHPRRARRR